MHIDIFRVKAINIDHEKGILRLRVVYHDGLGGADTDCDITFFADNKNQKIPLTYFEHMGCRPADIMQAVEDKTYYEQAHTDEVHSEKLNQIQKDLENQ